MDGPICGTWGAPSAKLNTQVMLALQTASYNNFQLLEGQGKTNLDCLSVLRRPLDTDTKQRHCASSLLCSWWWESSQEWILPRDSEHSLDYDQNQFHRVIFLRTRYLQSLSTINSGMWEYKQPAVSQLYGRITLKKLVAMIMLCVFYDPEKWARFFQWFSIWDAVSVVCYYGVHSHHR